MESEDIAQGVIGIWRENFGGIELSPEDEFFSLGGSSLIAVRIINSVQDLLDAEIPMITLFKYPKLRTFVEEVQAIARSAKKLPASS